MSFVLFKSGVRNECELCHFEMMFYSRSHCLQPILSRKAEKKTWNLIIFDASVRNEALYEDCDDLQGEDVLCLSSN